MDKENNEIIVLENKCRNVSNEVKKVNNNYKDRIGNNPEIIDGLSQAMNRSKEYEKKTFIVLVVGPVKSGKSTLVNLIANKYVSPTHFLECTVRPSVISRRRNENEDCKITVFTSEDTSNRIEQIDDIIDCIRGFESEDSLKNIRKEKFDLTDENIKQKVELGLKESLSSETLVTSITTPGGQLMKEEVFIVDMPGFDGEYANIDDPIYDTIAQRADLVIFVQSSNSAINKVSGQFLKKLAENNQGVPVCLIHNVFDSAWWRSHDDRSVAVNEQKKFAIKEVRKLNFQIEDELCFSLNLGMIEDSRKQKYSEKTRLQDEAKEYDKIEGILYNRIIDQRNSITLTGCLKRTRQKLEKTVDAIDKEIKHRNELNERYNKIVYEFSKIPDKLNFDKIKPLEVNYATLKDEIRKEGDRRTKLLSPDNNHKTDTEVTDIVKDFINACGKTISETIPKSLSLDDKEDALYRVCKERIGEINNTSRNCGVQPVEKSVEKRKIGEIPDIDLSQYVDLNLSISHKTKINILIKQFGGHSAENIAAYINRLAAYFIGSEENNSDEGCIEKAGGVVKPILESVERSIENVKKEYEDECNGYLAACRNAVLREIIPNKSEFENETKALGDLKEELLKIQKEI